MRILTSNIFIGVFGIAVVVVGAAGYANLSNRNSTHNLIAIDDPSTPLRENAEPTDQSVVANVATLNSIEASSDHNASGDSDYFPDVDKSIAKTTLDSNTSNSPPESLLFALDGIKIEMLNGLNADQSVVDQAIDQVAKWFEHSPNPAIEIFDFLTSDASEDIKLSLIHLIASGEYEGLTENILDEMSLADEAAHGEWLDIVSTTSINSPSEREAMLNVLPFLTNDSLVIATLGAVRPQLLPIEERSQFLSAISGYASSENVSSHPNGTTCFRVNDAT